MLKAVLRLLSMILLSVAVIMAVLDATRSIAAGAFVLTPLGASWKALSPDTLAAFEELVHANLPDVAWDPGALALLGLPGFVVSAALALLFALGGRRRERRNRYGYAI